MFQINLKCVNMSNMSNLLKLLHILVYQRSLLKLKFQKSHRNTHFLFTGELLDFVSEKHEAWLIRSMCDSIFIFILEDIIIYIMN